jgi:hypothetical protein
MSAPAGQDEHPETDEYPREGNVPLGPRHQIEERDRNGDVRKADGEIAEQMKSDQAGVPQVTMPMRHEAVTFEQPAQKVWHLKVTTYFWA